MQLLKNGWRKHSQKFRLRSIVKQKNILLRNRAKWIMNKKQKKVCMILSYSELFLILASEVTGCVSISSFASLVGILIGITSFAVGLTVCVITVALKKYKSVIKKKKKKHK